MAGDVAKRVGAGEFDAGGISGENRGWAAPVCSEAISESGDGDRQPGPARQTSSAPPATPTQG